MSYRAVWYFRLVKRVYNTGSRIRGVQSVDLQVMMRHCTVQLLYYSMFHVTHCTQPSSTTLSLSQPELALRPATSPGQHQQHQTITSSCTTIVWSSDHWWDETNIFLDADHQSWLSWADQWSQDCARVWSGAIKTPLIGHSTRADCYNIV